MITLKMLAFAFLFVLLPSIILSASPLQAQLQFQTSSPLHTFDSTFLSVNIDTASLDASIDLTDPTLINIIKQLGDVWLRVGGTSANTLVYVPDGPAGNVEGHAQINDAYWVQLGKLQQATNASLLFGLPLQLNSQGVYDPTINATALWESTVKHNINVDGWSLGNELFAVTFNVDQYVSDYKIFASALAQYPSIGQRLFGPSAAGFPGTAPISTFISGTSSFVSEFTFHAYAFYNCSLDEYVQKANVERMQKYFNDYTTIRNQLAPNSPLVLEEAATQAQGGCEGLSDRFVSGFWWVHTLGLAAASGIHRVHRQDVAGFSFNNRPSHYILAGEAGWINSSISGPLSPHPDWFTAVLHKQLAGEAILNSSLSSNKNEPEISENVAVHVWCSAIGANAPLGSLTLSYINMGIESNDTQLLLPSAYLALPHIQYILTPGPPSKTTNFASSSSIPQTLTSDTIMLNGEAMSVGEDGMLPQYPIQGNLVPSSNDIILPAWSYGFIVLVGANVTACQ